jgi:hypothetical protein
LSLGFDRREKQNGAGRKSPAPLEHDPQKVGTGFPKKIMLKKIEQDDDSSSRSSEH